MKELDFRKGRGRGSNRRRPKNSRRGGLRFEEKRGGLSFGQERTRRGRVDIKAAVLWAVEILIVCMAAVLLVASFGQRVSVSGDSMSPVLKNGQTVMVNRLVYRFAEPARGDVIAFRQGGDGNYIVKRIVGLPGETVQISEGKILINGEVMTADIHVSGIEYAGLAEEPVELGKDEYFVMGDHDTASDDSRIPGIGNVKKEEIYGKVWFIAGPADDMGFI